MSRHAVRTTVAVVVAAISLAVLSQQVQEQDEQPPARASEDLLAAIEAARAKLRALDEPADIRTSAEQAALFHTAAEQGNADAQFALGMMYTNGEGVLQNDAEAVRWYRRAAATGDENAREASEMVAQGMSANRSPKAPQGRALEWANR